ncbi:MAG: WecB/TagA/CpsF family glycosyltransferase [Candidatus Omnitrophica bacterium]|nr:WecB/TagA/CpsF family glycosyltransferase [Candidatus Omnitrophota bacterium]
MYTKQSNMVVNICGVNIHNFTLSEAIERIDSLTVADSFSLVATPNIDHVIRLQKDIDFMKAYNESAIVFPDSMPILWAAKFLGTPFKEKISGSDLFPKLCEVASQKGRKVFFLGGREGAATKSVEILVGKFPDLQVVGTYCPPFGFEHDEQENRKVIEIIQKAKPDILFVGLGAPKQEKWICKYKDQYQVPVSIGIGGSLEFVSGMVKRAPKWMQNAGLEWFWRLIMEPRRLWKRYLIDDPIFFWLVLKQKFSKECITK